MSESYFDNQVYTLYFYLMNQAFLQKLRGNLDWKHLQITEAQYYDAGLTMLGGTVLLEKIMLRGEHCLWEYMATPDNEGTLTYYVWLRGDLLSRCLIRLDSL